MRRFWTMLAHYYAQTWNASELARSMRIALEDCSLDHLWIIYPGPHTYPVHDKITVWSLQEVADLPSQL